MTRRVVSELGGGHSPSAKRVLIYGAGDACQMIVREMQQNPSLGNRPATFAGLLRAVDHVAQQMPVIFPVHPRTATRAHEISGLTGDLRVVEPLRYLDFPALTSSAALILTDSGGLQEESTLLGVPCLTMRDNTERPVTITHGTNVLVGTDPDVIIAAADRVLTSATSRGNAPDLWDGHAAQRIVDVLLDHFSE